MTKARDIASAIPAPSTVSSAELGYLDGVTSAIQTQIDSKIGSASAINPTIVDAKGDIIAATAADTVAKLTVGANGTVLTAASGQATGLEWATVAAGGMTLLSTTSLSGTSTTVSSINQTYKDLKIVVRGAISSSISTVQGIRLNGDTGANYTYEGYPSIGGIGANEIYYGLTTTSGDYEKVHVGEISIMRYAETENKLITYISHQNAGSNRTQVGTGRWDNTSPITSFTLCTGAGTYSAGTIYIYGVK